MVVSLASWAQLAEQLRALVRLGPPPVSDQWLEDVEQEAEASSVDPEPRKHRVRLLAQLLSDAP